MVDIRREMHEIRKALEKALEHAEKFKKELARITVEHSDNIWNLVQNIANNSVNNGAPSTLPDIEGMMNSIGLESPISNGISFQIGGTVSSLQGSIGENGVNKSLLCFGEGPDVESLITANESLIMT